MSDGVVRDLIQVRFVPKLKRNLISIRMLDQSGCTIKAEKKKTLKIIKGWMVITTNRIRNGLYVLDGQTIVSKVRVTDYNKDKANLWHLRWGHTSEKWLKEL